MNNTPAGLRATTQKTVEVRLWETYMIRSRTNLYQVLCDYSLDRGPLQRLNETERIYFRFMRYDWDKTISIILTEDGIPFEIVRAPDIDVAQHLMKMRKKIYVMEDDLDILFALNTILEEAGYDVLLSHCGAPMLQRHLPATDLFILDKRMPDVDGLEVCKHLKAQP